MTNPRAITRLVIHCSASPNGRPVSIAEIDAWHKARGFQRAPAAVLRWNPAQKHIGYHWVIGVDGAISPGRSVGEVGAHVVGFNFNSLGLCIIGTDSFAPAQWLALRNQVSAVTEFYPDIAVVGHRDLSPDKNGDGRITSDEWLKRCPGFDVAAWLARDMRPETAHVLEATR
ncbi:N-acetylmuramoyl-L-alanine amidase [Nevskia ramosa]|uniref:N-acetylmuramoyl-L-alanine amidase n=1 Tax=Nevskia ramosa TaxID=64002 RepID=UPI002355531B|nr:N-acetylmuramoyl-L-alanine amidase [Nevskia ramosa]